MATLGPAPIEKIVDLFKFRNRTSHLFKIDNFSLFKKYGIKMVESSVFELGGRQWSLSVYPNGTSDANGYFSIFLNSQASVNVNVQYAVFVVSQRGPDRKTSGRLHFGIHSTKFSKGETRLISLGDLKENGYLVKDCCLCGVELLGIKLAASGTAECFSLIEKPPNHKVTWMITRFSSFDTWKDHHSDEFVVGNRKWRIEIYPTHFEEEDESLSVSLLPQGFIDNSSAKTETFANFKLRVLDQVNRNHVEKTCSDWLPSLGHDNCLCLTKLVEPYLVKDKLYVGVDFEVVSVSSYC